MNKNIDYSAIDIMHHVSKEWVKLWEACRCNPLGSINVYEFQKADGH